MKRYHLTELFSEAINADGLHADVAVSGKVRTPVVRKSAGYKLDKLIRWNGLQVAVENRAGSVRRGTDADGKPWKTKMLYDYGGIRGTSGFSVDSDLLDCFIGPHEESQQVYVIHQQDPGTKRYDEDKVMLGFATWEQARDAYLAHYDNQDFLPADQDRAVTVMSLEQFRQRIADRRDNARMRAKEGRPPRRGMLKAVVRKGYDPAEPRDGQGRWTFALEPSESHHDRVRNTILLLSRDGEATIPRLREMTGLSGGRLLSVLGDLVDSGEVIKDGTFYRLRRFGGATLGFSGGGDLELSMEGGPPTGQGAFDFGKAVRIRQCLHAHLRLRELMKAAPGLVLTPVEEHRAGKLIPSHRWERPEEHEAPPGDGGTFSMFGEEETEPQREDFASRDQLLRRYPLGEHDVPRHLIEPDFEQDRDQEKFQSEEDQKDLRALAASIKQHGLQQRIVVRPNPDRPGMFRIIAGQRRFTALGMIPDERTPVKIIDADDETAADIQMFENLARKDLDDIEEAHAYARRMERFGSSIEEIAKKAAVRPQRVEQRLKLLKLIPELQFLVKGKQLAVGMAIKASRLEPNRQAGFLRYMNTADPAKLTAHHIQTWIDTKLAEQQAEAQRGFEFGVDDDLVSAVNRQLGSKAAVDRERVSEAQAAYQSLLAQASGALNRLIGDDKEKLLPVALSQKLPQAEDELTALIGHLSMLRDHVRTARSIRDNGGNMGDYVRTVGVRRSRKERLAEARDAVTGLRDQARNLRRRIATAEAKVESMKGKRGAGAQAGREAARSALRGLEKERARVEAEIARVSGAVVKAVVKRVPGGTPLDDPNPDWLECQVSGRNGVRYRARYHRKKNRIEVLGGDGEPVRKGLDLLLSRPVGPTLVDAIEGHHVWVTGAWYGILKGRRFSAQEMEDMSLRWITFHPNGKGTEPGIPIIVHDDGTHYTVVGGAGGKLNQMVLQKPEGHQKEDAAAAKKRPKPPKPKPDITEEFRQEATEKKTAIREEIAKQSADLRQRVMDELGVRLQDVLPRVRAEAEKRARKENPAASAEEVKAFADKAEKQAVKEADSAVHQVVNAALEREAMRELSADVGDEAVKPAEVVVKLSDRQIVRQMDDEQIKSVLSAQHSLDAMKAQVRAIEKALRTGDTKVIDGIDTEVDRHQPTDAELHEWAEKGYYERESVIAHTALVKGSLQASTQAQTRYQGAGAADAINTYVGTATGQAILGPELAKQFGIENAARVAAEYLREQGKGGEEGAEEIRGRMAEQGYAHAAAAVMKAGEMDDMVTQSKEMAAEGDGTVTVAQASIMAANMAQPKYRLLNVARGQLRGIQALAEHLKNPHSGPMEINGGDTTTAAHATAKQLGLESGDYRVQKQEGGGYAIRVEREAITKLTQPRRLKDAQRSQAMDEVREAAQDGWESYRVEGMNPNLTWLGPYQMEAIEGVKRVKKLLVAHSPGTGKTSTLYGMAQALLTGGHAQRGIITMPQKPRSQQDDYTDPETGERKDGKKSLFLGKESAAETVVVKDGAHLKRVLREVNAGKVKTLIMSPELVREHVGLLMADPAEGGGGFGRDGTFFLGDEAHQGAIGKKDRAGSQLAQAMKKIVQGSEYAALATGTPLENDASELHSLVDMLQPGVAGSQSQFSSEWQRLAQSGGGLYGDQAGARMRDRLSGVMSYVQRDPVRKEPDGVETPVQLERQVVNVPLAPWQREEIAKINQQYDKNRRSADPNKARAAGLTRRTAVNGVLTGGSADPNHPRYNPKYGKLAEIAADEKGRDSANRVLVHANTNAALRTAGGVLGQHGRVVQITGAEKERESADAARAVNDRGNDVAGAALSVSANFGIDLQGGDHLVKMHPLATPAQEDQFDHRHWRHGQDRDVRATTLAAQHPLEQLAQFRTERVKKPELELLGKLASGADESGRVAAMLPDLAVIERVAGLGGGGTQPTRKAVVIRRGERG